MGVNLVIKSAAQSVDDFDLSCELTWTIGLVKEKISELYPTKPKKENQKLIYGGKLLPDHLCLKSILNHSQERHILHLVCPTPEVTANPNESKQATSTQSFPVPPTNSAFPPLSQPMLNTQGLSSMPSVNVAPFAPSDPFQQYLAMQQMYNQFMTQYLSQYNGGVPPTHPYARTTAVVRVQTPQVPPRQQNVARNPRQQAGEEEVQDYLDYVYIFSRALILFAVLYYYSSLSRVLMVVGMFLLISVYVKVNRENRQERQRQANERQRTETVVVTQPVAADIQAENRETAHNTAPSTEEASLSQQTEGRSFTSVVSTTLSIVSAFFTSLIPADPVPVNVN